MRKILVFFLLLFPLQSQSATKDSINFIVAKVNNKAITNHEIENRYNLVVFLTKIKISSVAEKKALLAQIIDKAIEEELIRQEAKKMNLTTSEEEITGAVEMLAAKQKKNATQIKLAFLKNNLSFNQYLQQVESEILWSKIIEESLRAKAKVSEAEVKEFLEQEKSNKQINKFLLAEIFIANSANAYEVASKLKSQLEQGADFQNIVMQFSSGAYSGNSGEIGWISQKDIDQKIYSAISKLGKGNYSDPILLNDGYHLFKVLDLKSEKHIEEKDFEQAQHFLFVRKLQNLAKGHLIDLRKKAFIEIDRSKLDSI